MFAVAQQGLDSRERSDNEVSLPTATHGWQRHGMDVGIPWLGEASPPPTLANYSNLSPIPSPWQAGLSLLHERVALVTFTK